MYSVQSFTSCGRDVGGGHFLLIGDVGTIYRCWRQWVEAGPWTEILGHLARKPNGQLHLVDSTLIKVHQAGQGTIGGSKHRAIGLTKGGHNSKLTTALNERGHVAALLFFPGQCAETTAAKKLLPPLAKIMVFVDDKGVDSDEPRHLIEDNDGLTCIPPRIKRTSHRWCDPEFYRNRHLVENIFQQPKY
jgi:transposase